MSTPVDDPDVKLSEWARAAHRYRALVAYRGHQPPDKFPVTAQEREEFSRLVRLSRHLVTAPCEPGPSMICGMEFEVREDAAELRGNPPVSPALTLAGRRAYWRGLYDDFSLSEAQ